MASWSSSGIHLFPVVLCLMNLDHHVPGRWGCTKRCSDEISQALIPQRQHLAIVLPKDWWQRIALKCSVLNKLCQSRGKDRSFTTLTDSRTGVFKLFPQCLHSLGAELCWALPSLCTASYHKSRCPWHLHRPSGGLSTCLTSCLTYLFFFFLYSCVRSCLNKWAEFVPTKATSLSCFGSKCDLEFLQ